VAPNGGYLPALDGLRAIAVVAVLAFHLDAPWAQGGFLGVDLFFVLSGFLITRLLLRASDGGRIELTTFWRRRLARLAPAMSVMVAATVVTAWLLGGDKSGTLRPDAIASLLYVSNWVYIARGVSYFDQLLPPSPLRHTWSLSIEEQFYIAWPLFVLACRLWSRRALLVGALLVAAVSLGLLVWFGRNGATDRAYYGTDARAFALAVGSLVAIRQWRRRSQSLRPGCHQWLIMPALVSFVIIVWQFGDESSVWFPVQLCLAALISAVAVAAASSLEPRRWTSWLGAAPMRFVGMRSYSIYLWHWPVIVLVNQRFDGAKAVLASLALSMTLAETSYRLVERPIRAITVPRRVVAVSLAMIGVSLAAAMVIPGRSDSVDVAPMSNIAPEPDVPMVTTIGPLPSSTLVAPDSSLGGATTTTVGAPLPPRVLVVGDSTALQFVYTVERLGLDTAMDVEAVAALGCSVVRGAPVDVGSDEPIPVRDECLGWRQNWANGGSMFHPDVVVMMIGAWEVFDVLADGRRYSFGSDEWAGLVGGAIDEAVAIAGSSGAPVAVLRVPCMDTANDAAFATASREDPDRVAAVNAFFEANVRPDGAVITLPYDTFLCPPDHAFNADGSDMWRYDGVHLDEDGARQVWSWLQAQLVLRVGLKPV
jgi:peptidoglycan/LPS O-acetylase OafA/YrhL